MHSNMLRKLKISKNGGEYVEAAVVLPILILLIISMIGTMVFFYSCANKQMKLHKSSLAKTEETTLLFKKEKNIEETSSSISGVAKVLLKDDIYASIYLINETNLIRAGKIAKEILE
ncbi:MAG: hypothetical protein SPI74_02340 [Eubacterium sp.]|nr:hypothetical protein [Eubacterium sp.]